MGRERNIGWGSDRLRGKRVWQDRASLGEASRRHYAIENRIQENVRKCVALGLDVALMRRRLGMFQGF